MPFIKLPTSQKGPPAGPFRSEASEAGIIPPLLLILLAALGIILFILISSSATFRDRLFSALFPNKNQLPRFLMKYF
ncbi:hypothetical protein HYT18_03975 [Candidatus Microgenomates bacterium]|nr:hypothetical protein [Candidatus Microgenomates bacterium]